ncbi:MAG TPA: ATP-dependent sacrificial sulfur transferase LarE [Candidatus Krumholzibacteria bacterium]|nr:ATP-dependent sacrificial sulfur transferase LarE [Candidatus Krumholzibacteria bacterium]
MTQNDMKLDPALAAALVRLRAAIAQHGPMVVAYSGGVDSGLLAKVAHGVLGSERMRCVIGVSPSLASGEEAAALAFLDAHGIPYVRIATLEVDDPRYRANTPDRCYFCKSELFERIESSPESRVFPVLAYGANADDRLDFRPGARAAREYGVVAPLAETDFTKAMVRAAARALDLVLWDKPASPCLASRIPYESAVTPEKLSQVDRAERVLKEFGFSVCRVRHHGDTARIEVPADELDRLRGDAWPEIERGVRAAGFANVDIDPRGFASGRLNEALRRSP